MEKEHDDREFKRLCSLLQERNEAIERLNGELESARGELQTKALYITELDEKLSAAKTRMAELRSQKDALNEVLDKRNAKITDLIADFDERSGNLHALINRSEASTDRANLTVEHMCKWIAGE